MEPNSKVAISRRNLLKAAAGLGVGVAAVGIPAVVFLEQDSEHTSASPSPDAPPSAQGPIVAYIRDAAAGEVIVMYGTEEVVVRDTKLVARLTGVVEG